MLPSAGMPTDPTASVTRFVDYFNGETRGDIDRTLEMAVLRMGRLRAIDIHPIERKASARQGPAP